MSLIVDIVMLWAHIFSAALFVGGSFFMWLVLVPASHRITEDEAARTQMVGKIAKSFGRVVNVLLVVLVATGLYNVSWYLPSSGSLFTTEEGILLVAKSLLVVVLLVLLYISNVYFGAKIMRFASEGRLEDLKAVRKKSTLVSLANLGLMVVILLLATMLQIPP